MVLCVFVTFCSLENGLGLFLVTEIARTKVNVSKRVYEYSYRIWPSGREPWSSCRHSKSLTIPRRWLMVYHVLNWAKLREVNFCFRKVKGELLWLIVLGFGGNQPSKQMPFQSWKRLCWSIQRSTTLFGTWEMHTRHMHF